MFIKALLKQNGVTLIELLVAIAIVAVLLIAVVTFSRSAITINRNTNNQANATNQLRSAFNYISRDTEQAGFVSTPSSNFPLTLSWIQYPSNQTDVIYTVLANGILQRTQYLNNVLQSTMNVANNVNSNAALTNCSWDNVQHDLTINMTISIGSINAARQFIITPKVVAGSIYQATSTVSLTSSGNLTTYGQLVTFTAVVTPNIVTGVVTFEDGVNILGTGNIIGGQTTFATSTLSVGVHSIKAVYSGDAPYGPSTSSGWTQTVNSSTPTLTGISPTNGTHGTNLNVILTGTNFISGVSTVIVTSGITIISTTVNSSMQITVNINISSSIGTQNFSVQNGAPGGGTSGTQSFTVN